MENLSFKLNKIKVVAFDFDDTLVDEKKLLKLKWQIVINFFSYLHSDLHDTFFKYYNYNDNKKKILDKVLAKLNLNLNKKKKIIKKFRDVRVKEFQEPWSSHLITFLKKNKIKVGIMTNGYKKYQKKRIKQLSYYNKLDFIYYGDSYKKPSKNFFYQSKELKNLNDPSNFLYIGNDFKLDILSTARFKMNNILLSKENVKYKNKYNTVKELYSFFRKEL